MMEPAGSGSLYQFGVFELDLQAGELRKRGIRIKLQEQPLQILGLLIGCSGEVVTREQIQQKLWCGETFVDFDNAINSAVRKIRDALGDNSENPRFVETVARRGYRFIAGVTEMPIGDDELRRFFTPWRYAPMAMIWDGRYVSIQPVAKVHEPPVAWVARAARFVLELETTRLGALAAQAR